jgi:hypothetical protein
MSEPAKFCKQTAQMISSQCRGRLRSSPRSIACPRPSRLNRYLFRGFFFYFYFSLAFSFLLPSDDCYRFPASSDGCARFPSFLLVFCRSNCCAPSPQAGWEGDKVQELGPGPGIKPVRRQNRVSSGAQTGAQSSPGQYRRPRAQPLGAGCV